MNLLWQTALGMYFVATDRFDEGESTLRHVLELEPSFWLAYPWLALIRLRRGLPAEALPLLEKAHALVPSNWYDIGLLAGTLERLGETRRAASFIEKLDDGAAFGAPARFVCYHYVRGDLDHAAEWFEKVIAQRDTRAPWILPHTLGSFLMSSPHWPRLAK